MHVTSFLKALASKVANWRASSGGNGRKGLPAANAAVIRNDGFIDSNAYAGADGQELTRTPTGVSVRFRCIVSHPERPLFDGESSVPGCGSRLEAVIGKAYDTGFQFGHSLASGTTVSRRKGFKVSEWFNRGCEQCRQGVLSGMCSAEAALRQGVPVLPPAFVTTSIEAHAHLHHCAACNSWWEFGEREAHVISEVEAQSTFAAYFAGPTGR